MPLPHGVRRLRRVARSRGARRRRALTVLGRPLFEDRLGGILLPAEVATYFAIEADGSFLLDSVLIEARPRGEAA